MNIGIGNIDIGIQNAMEFPAEAEVSARIGMVRQVKRSGDSRFPFCLA